jgi:hypothetical protein
MGWQAKFDDPIPPPGARQLGTLEDAGSYITKLPKAEHEAPEWQAAMACPGEQTCKCRFAADHENGTEQHHDSGLLPASCGRPGQDNDSETPDNEPGIYCVMQASTASMHSTRC